MTSRLRSNPSLTLPTLVLLASCSLRGSSVGPTPTTGPATSDRVEATFAPADAKDSPVSPIKTPYPATPSASVEVGLRRLTDDPAIDRDPTWSGDGQRIAYSSNRTGNYELYAMPVDGGQANQLTDDEGLNKEMPTWSPHGRQIAFATLLDVDLIFAFDVEPSYANPFSVLAGSIRPLTNRAWMSRAPDWSPDGERLAFTTDDFSPDYRIHLLDLATGEVEVLSAGPTPAVGPTWSPDGERILFGSDAEGNLDKYVIELDGLKVTRLTNDPADDSSGGWSPDGEWIVFSSNRGGSWDLYLMKSDGSQVTKLETGGEENFDPEWSPDGRFIVFVSTRDGNPEIYRMNAPSLQP